MVAFTSSSAPPRCGMRSRPTGAIDELDGTGLRAPEPGFGLERLDDLEHVERLELLRGLCGHIPFAFRTVHRRGPPTRGANGQVPCCAATPGRARSHHAPKASPSSTAEVDGGRARMTESVPGGHWHSKEAPELTNDARRACVNREWAGIGRRQTSWRIGPLRPHGSGWSASAKAPPRSSGGPVTAHGGQLVALKVARDDADSVGRSRARGDAARPGRPPMGSGARRCGPELPRDRVGRGLPARPEGATGQDEPRTARGHRRARGRTRRSRSCIRPASATET